MKHTLNFSTEFFQFSDVTDNKVYDFSNDYQAIGYSFELHRIVHKLKSGKKNRRKKHWILYFSVDWSQNIELEDSIKAMAVLNALANDHEVWFTPSIGINLSYRVYLVDDYQGQLDAHPGDQGNLGLMIELETDPVQELPAIDPNQVAHGYRITGRRTTKTI